MTAEWKTQQLEKVQLEALLFHTYFFISNVAFKLAILLIVLINNAINK